MVLLYYVFVATILPTSNILLHHSIFIQLTIYLKFVCLKLCKSNTIFNLQFHFVQILKPEHYTYHRIIMGIATLSKHIILTNILFFRNIYFISMNKLFAWTHIYFLHISLILRFYEHFVFYIFILFEYIYNTCTLSKHIGNMCMRLRNGGKPSLFPRFAPNIHDRSHTL